ncbi:MAG: NAD(P)/FAD-dependent oxidoreductase [Bacteroidetes bacterium]|nr:NAD(P)/FAD-dependent oxidoreductase [Bacteroidota bacterium]
MTLTADVLVLGGGAAGFFAAVNTARLNPRLKVVVVEKSAKLLAKVLISGGGRCNVTHHCFDKGTLVGHYPRGGAGLRQVFARWGPEETIEWFAKRGVPLKTELDGRMFPTTDRSETIARCLLLEAEKYGVSVYLNTHYNQIEYIDEQFQLRGPHGAARCKKLLVATGGHPKAEAYQWLAPLGHRIVSPVPSLFTFNLPKHPITELMGVAVPETRIRLPELKKEVTGPLLITHWGLSGPAVLRLSALAARELHDRQYHFSVAIHWLPSLHEEQIRNQLLQQQSDRPHAVAVQYLPFPLPTRLARFLGERAGVLPDKRWMEVRQKDINRLAGLLAHDTYEAKGKTTFKEEFVTAGGVHLGDVNLTDMQSKHVPGLYFAGEVLDIDGVTGGFNFQSAWSTGWVAAESISKSW